MYLKTKLAIVIAAGLLVLSACEAPDLDRIQSRNIVSLTGSFMTESPDEINFPVKVLFAIDCSLSMGDEVDGVVAGADPYFLRIEAVRNFIDTYNSNENASFEIMLWNNDVFERTRTIDGNGGFTKDPDELNRVLDAVRNDTMTDYLGTLDAIHTDIQRDINHSDEESLIRSKYVVIFLSDGMSNVQGGSQPNVDIWNSVSEIYEMAEDHGVGGFNFHTFLLLGMFDETASGQAARAYAENTLQGMADRGNGQFRLFETAEAIDFVNIIDMRLTVEYKIKYLVAYNVNVQAGIELVYVDSDGDGLIDADEAAYGTNASAADTDGDGLSDYFEIAVSSPGYELDPLLQDSPCDSVIEGPWPDTDLDGLTDCEEYVKGTNRRMVDTDADGIPDGIEFVMGTNPLEIQDTNDSDFDGVVDWLEVQKHTNVTSNDPKIRKSYSYDYNIQDRGLVPIEQGVEQPSYVRKYQFDISNIDVMDTREHTTDSGDLWIQGDNLIRFYIAQVPEDDPDSPPLFRLAEVLVNVDDRGDTIVLTPNDFMLLE
jgi:hypothetical protein